jgi:hypothetical protein
MYDFYYGNKDDILANPEEFLIFCKRLLPRWVNGIPDTELIAIWRILEGMGVDKPILVETGSGASSLALFMHAALRGGKLFSWDTNGSKGAFLRQVISDSMCRVLEIDIHKVWTFVGFSSTDAHVGIQVLSELNLKADFGFFDSWHTLTHLTNEIECFEKIAKPQFVIALDDAYYECRNENLAYVNMIRSKLGLPAVIEPLDNKCKPFYVEIETCLKAKNRYVEKLNDDYKQLYIDDIFFRYYDLDRAAMNKLGMENKEKLDHRLDAWLVKSDFTE